jgi:hypothetical protein
MFMLCRAPRAGRDNGNFSERRPHSASRKENVLNTPIRCYDLSSLLDAHFSRAKQILVIFITTDYMGISVIASDSDWKHVIDGHSEMIGREQFVEKAIHDPDEVYEGSIAGRKTFIALNIATGFWAGHLTVAVVRYNALANMGHLTTAYLANAIPPRWVSLWKKKV